LSLASPSTATVFRALYALPFLVVLALPEERRLGPPDGRARLLALGAGLFFALDLTSFHLAIGEIGAGLATVMANLQVIVVGVVAWLLLGERPSGRILFGAPLAVLGIVLISGVLGGGAYGRDPGLGAGYGVVSAFAYAGYLLVLRRARAPGRFVGPVRDATAATVVGGIAGGLLLNDLVLVPTWPAHGWLLLLAISAQVVGGLLIAASLPHLPAVVSSLILLSQPVASVVLAAILLGEAPSLYQVAGVGLVVAGVAVGTLPVGHVAGRLGRT
jgi:drug/metabolite transporter (DMT)-like permease